MTLTEAQDWLDTVIPAKVTPADYPRLAKALVTVRDGHRNRLERRGHALVNAVLRDLYAICEHRGGDWSVWVE